MEYRGYDSAGIAVWTEDGLEWRKKAGKLSNLEAELAQDPVPVAHLGIGHTRWATHGAPTDTNAHPHVSSDGRIALIHNGIIENFASLRAEQMDLARQFRVVSIPTLIIFKNGQEVQRMVGVTSKEELKDALK